MHGQQNIKRKKKYIQVTSGLYYGIQDQEVPVIQDKVKELGLPSTGLFITLLNIFIICF